MKRRLAYIVAFILILVLEILIGVYVRDNFVRPYVGDMLVTVLLCCLSRAIFPKRSPALPVFVFAALVEAAQGLGLAEALGVEGTVIGVILGSTFDWRDIVCYGVGCLAFTAVEWAVFKMMKKSN